MTAPDRERLRLELARAIRMADDEEVQRILVELGPLGEAELDNLDDHGVSGPAWGVNV